jgi:TolB-like protein
VYYTFLVSDALFPTEKRRAARTGSHRRGFGSSARPLDVKMIGRELNVRYVLEGSVQRGGNRMRVNV